MSTLWTFLSCLKGIGKVGGTELKDFWSFNCDYVNIIDLMV